jgi:hypothetical protein
LRRKCAKRRFEYAKRQKSIAKRRSQCANPYQAWVTHIKAASGRRFSRCAASVFRVLRSQFCCIPAAADKLSPGRPLPLTSRSEGEANQKRRKSEAPNCHTGAIILIAASVFGLNYQSSFTYYLKNSKETQPNGEYFRLSLTTENLNNLNNFVIYEKNATAGGRARQLKTDRAQFHNTHRIGLMLNSLLQQKLNWI